MLAGARFKGRIKTSDPGSAVNTQGRIRLWTENSNTHYLEMWFVMITSRLLPIPKERVSISSRDLTGFMI